MKTRRIVLSSCMVLFLLLAGLGIPTEGIRALLQSEGARVSYVAPQRSETLRQQLAAKASAAVMGFDQETGTFRPLSAAEIKALSEQMPRAVSVPQRPEHLEDGTLKISLEGTKPNFMLAHRGDNGDLHLVHAGESCKTCGGGSFEK